MTPTRNVIRGHLAAAVRHHPDDTDSIAELRQAYKFATAEDYIAKVVAHAPPLSLELRARLAAILLTPAGGGPDAC